MCGLVGYKSNRPDERDREVLVTMLSKLNHRGPDGFGMWFDESAGLALGHARLAVIDLSNAGHQPMVSDSQRFVIVFNGEIYNHQALRKQLNVQGAAPAWYGHSDTETLLACVDSWGIKETLKCATGMFSLALWDKKDQVLTLARDRLGEKPMYWGWSGDTLLFGSELKAIKAHPNFIPEVNRSALALLLRHNYIPAPHTIYCDIKKLPAGHYIQIPIGKTKATPISQPYWQLKTVIESGLFNPVLYDEKKSIDKLEECISTAISQQMLADVPVGAFLSGGVDSSLIAALMQRQSAKPIRTFTIGFEDQKYNEAVFASEIARHLGTEHTELYMNADDALELVPNLPNIFCEPFADSSQLPTYLVSRLAKKDVTVALSGDGGDELFCGYNHYKFAPVLWKRISKLPVKLRKILSAVLGGMPLSEKARKFISVFPAADREAFYQALVSHWDEPNKIIKGATSSKTLLNDAAQWPTVNSFESWMMGIDAGQYMSDDILVKVDRAAMANSLETRVPLLDHRVVEFAWRLPLNLKIRDGVGKWALRQVLYRHVPHSMIERPKKGFSIPLAEWLRGPLHEWADELLDSRRLVSEGYFHPEQIQRIWKSHLTAKQDHSSKLWSILMFQAWLEKN